MAKLNTEERVERFWEKVDRNGPLHPILGTRCWTWTASTFPSGYGQFKDGGGPVQAHRFSLRAAMGMFAGWLDLRNVSGRRPLLDVDHKCHNPACVRPVHLRALPQKENQENRRGSNTNSSSGVRGVFWDKRAKRWRTEFQHNGKHIHVGYFDGPPPPAAPPPEAEAAVIAARNKVFTCNEADRWPLPVCADVG